MTRTKNNKKRKIWADFVAVVILGAWAYLADAVFAGAQMQAADYPLIGSTIAGVIPVNKLLVFIVGVLFYLLTSSLAMSRFIGCFGSLIVMTEIMIVEPVQKFMELAETLKEIGEADGITDAQMALERYGIFPWRSEQSGTRVLAYIGAALMIFLLVYFIVTVIKDRKAKNTTGKALRNTLIFLAILAFLIFIPGLIMGTGPQWLFLSLMTLLAFVTFMYGVIKRSNKGAHVVSAAVTIVLMAVIMLLDISYRMGAAGFAI